MTEIEFSYIGDSPEDVQRFPQLIEDFQQGYRATVHLKPLTWDQAWTELLDVALHRKGPDVSQIGDTWISSFVGMNALRPFSSQELAAMGGKAAFAPATHYSMSLPDDTRVWSVPWTSYIYLICYRKDLLQKAGVDEKTAFGSPEVLKQTILRLKEAGVAIPWLMPSGPEPFNDLLHIAASWVWGMGGDFISSDGKKAIFNQPAAFTALRTFLEFYRYLPPAANLDMDQCVQMFAQGEAAMTVADVRSANSLHQLGAAPQIIENLGTANFSRVPWVGGSNLVIWQHIQASVEKERAALAWIKYLTSDAGQSKFSQLVGTIPARTSALSVTLPAGHPLKSTLEQAGQTGRGYPKIGIWQRIELQLSLEIGEMIQAIWADPNVDIEAQLHQHIDYLARRLDLALTT
jgi:multiple sugar transport system substrate-binding protein